MNRDEMLNFLKNEARGISVMFGPNCETIVHDNVLHDYAIGHPWLHYVAAAAGAVLVVAVGKWMNSRGEVQRA